MEHGKDCGDLSPLHDCDTRNTVKNTTRWQFCAHDTVNASNAWKEKVSNFVCSNIWIPCRPSAKGWESEPQCCHPPSAWTSGSEATSFASTLCHACGSCQPETLKKTILSWSQMMIFIIGFQVHQTKIKNWTHTCDCKVSVLPTKSSIFSPRSNI